MSKSSPPAPRTMKLSEKKALKKQAQQGSSAPIAETSTSTPAKISTAASTRSAEAAGISSAPATDVKYESKARPVEDFPDLVDVLPALAAESLDLAAKIKPLEDRRKEIAEDLKALVEAAGYNSIHGDDWTVVRQSGGGIKFIDPLLLLQHDVSVKTIEACTAYTKKYWQLQVRARKASE